MPPPGAFVDGAPDIGCCDGECGRGAGAYGDAAGGFVAGAGFCSFVDGAGAYGDGAAGGLVPGAAAGFGAYGDGADGGFVPGGCDGRGAGRWLAVGGGRVERRVGSGTPARVVGGVGPSGGLPEGGSPPSEDMRAS